jgi:ATP-dependent DNA helicase RecG
MKLESSFDALMSIITKIETPILFCSNDSFKHLDLIKDLDGVMKFFLSELDICLRSIFTAINREELLNKEIEELKEIMLGFDSCNHEIKKERIAKASKTLNIIKQEILNHQSIVHKRDLVSFDDFENLSLPIQYIKGIGPKFSVLLEKKGLKTVEDLLYYIPRRYEDRRVVKKVASALIGRKETIVGEVVSSQEIFYGRKRIFEVKITDNDDILVAKWFRGNQRYLRKTFIKGKKVIMTGEVSSYISGKEMLHPDFEILDNSADFEDMLHFGRIVPIYSETEGLHQKYIRRIMMEVVTTYSKYLRSPIPEAICVKKTLENITYTIGNLHFPALNENIEILNSMQSQSHKRLIYDEFFFFELGMALRKRGNLLESGNAFNTGGALLGMFYKILPFSLTKSQEKVIDEILNDMKNPFPMNRLLQGDVGCGKTAVAMAAMITACENGYQAAIMAPTEILAEQHHDRIRNWAKDIGLEVLLLTGNIKQSDKKKILEKISCGAVNIIIGTHALIQDEVIFNRLGLVVIDEQHRFGVIQRTAIRKKGVNPDVLVMTATPIPRTLAMTAYGDLDYSLIDTMPPGRKSIRTKVYYEQHRNKVYEIVSKELAQGNQVFIVYPLVAESENLDLKNATRMAEILQKEVFPSCHVGLIHGRMKKNEKDEVMSAFFKKQLDILVSTTVIEVGIDIPNASVMIIEHAERFGLSQLHQLRGRIGRSEIPSFCILMSGNNINQESKKRLRIMEKTNDGFMIAEEDLAIRGPGEFMGTRQSGLPDFRVANILRDVRILSEAREDAISTVDNDPELVKPENRLMKQVLLHRWGARLDLAKTC